MRHNSIPHVWSLLAVLLCTCSGAVAQSIPQGYFRSPLEGDIALSATFAEFRANHFHGGLDMRTGGVTGKPVRAAADGYVSRISISPWGGGKILYITHPNGYTTLYMHLDGYAGRIGQWVKREQYRQQTYALFVDVPEGELPVRQGDVVAYSGNTGGSGGPHLHFEVRKDGRGWNPLHFGLPYRDGIKPTIRGLRIYPLGGKPIDVGTATALNVAGPFYLGIYATDAAEGSTPRNGIDHLEVLIDGEPYYHFNTHLIPIDSTRMVNAIIDYTHYTATRQAYLLTRVLPGVDGPWGYVADGYGDGVLRLQPGTTHSLKVRVFDVAGNIAERTLNVTAKQAPTATKASNGIAIKYNRPFSTQQGRWKIEMEAGTLYADDQLAIAATDTLTIGLVQNDIPPQRWYNIGFRHQPPAHVEARQVVLVRQGKRPTAYTTTVQGGQYTARVRDFGSFAIACDTVPPTVAAINFTPNNAVKTNTLKIKISDDLSGIEQYKCYLNGEWILAEYDGKTAMLVIDANGKMHPGRNTLRAEVSDACGNTNQREWQLIR